MPRMAVVTCRRVYSIRKKSIKKLSLLICLVLFIFLVIFLIKEKIWVKLKSSPAQVLNLMLMSPLVEKNRNFTMISLPNLPSVYHSQPESHGTRCGWFPGVYDLHYNNRYWQKLVTSNGTLYLYGAYYDVRANNRLGPTIQVLAMMDRISPRVSINCQLWYNNNNKMQNMTEPSVAKVVQYNYIWRKQWGNYKEGVLQPYLLSCPIPSFENGPIPDSVSLVEKPCDKATNNLRMVYNKLMEIDKQDFCVCVKGLDILDDISVRLVEWIEILLAVGVQKISVYKLEVHNNVSKVLEYYQKRGILDVTPITLPGDQPNHPGLQYQYLKHKLTNKRQNEVVPYNDCLYRNMYRYKYVALLDLDEVIIPMNSSTWANMLVKVKEENTGKKDTDTYNFRNVYFMDDMLLTRQHGHFRHIPPYFHMMQHVFRSKQHTAPFYYVKCFHDTQQVLTLHNHFPISCLSGYCRTTSVPPSVAQLQHYRPDCVAELKKSCKLMRNNTIRDTRLWRWGGEVINAVTQALWEMEFFGNNPGTLPPFVMTNITDDELDVHLDGKGEHRELIDLHQIVH